MSNIDINSEIRTQQQITDSGNPRKPTGDDGQKMLERMNESHYAVTRSEEHTSELQSHA